MAAGSIVALVLAEIALRLFLPTPTHYMVHTPNTQAVFEHMDEWGIQGPSLYRINSMGVRGREWSADRSSEIRVLAVGGSTTECVPIDQSRLWTTLLEEKLSPAAGGRRVWVGNIGKSGLNSRHHVIQMEHLLPVYDPDIVVMLVGVNDLSVRLMRGDAYDPRFLEDPENLRRLREQAFAVYPDESPRFYASDPWLKRTRLWRLVRAFKYQILHRPLRQDSRGETLRQWRALRASGGRSDDLPPLDEALDEYERNLSAIVDAIRRHGAVPVMLTQPVLWRPDLTEREEALLWLGGVGAFQETPGSLYYTPAALSRGMEAYNQRLLSVCRELDAVCVDLALVIPPTTEYFYDDCHFTDAAQGLVADSVAGEIIAEGERTGF